MSEKYETLLTRMATIDINSPNSVPLSKLQHDVEMTMKKNADTGFNKISMNSEKDLFFNYIYDTYYGTPIVKLQIYSYSNNKYQLLQTIEDDISSNFYDISTNHLVTRDITGHHAFVKL